MKCWVEIDIRGALDPNDDREEVSIFDVPEDRVLKSNFGGTSTPTTARSTARSTQGLPSPLGLRPSGHFDFGVLATTRRALKLPRFCSRPVTVLHNFQHYNGPGHIVLKKDTPREAVCTVSRRSTPGNIASTSSSS